MAAAALLEQLLAGGTVDEASLLDPNAGKEEAKKKKKWQVGRRAGWGWKGFILSWWGDAPRRCQCVPGSFWLESVLQVL